MLLSIIIPVYNVEQYLSKCLNSLLQQDIAAENYEIIVVNDGSTDDSMAIAEEYAQKHQNIIIITQENKGLGGARNTGIRHATGKYLWFVDSDDYIESNVLKELLDFIEKKELEILRFNYEAVKENGNIIAKKNNSLHSIVYSENIVTGEEFLSKQLGWACYAVMFLFDTEFIKKNNLYFNENIYFEDIEWLIKVLLKTERICSYNKCVYYYLQREGSITKSKTLEKKEKVYNDKLFVIQYLQTQIENSQNKQVILWLKGMISLTVISLLPYVCNQIPHKKDELYLFISKNKLLPLRPYRFTLRQFITLILINISPKLFCRLKKRIK